MCKSLMLLESTTLVTRQITRPGYKSKLYTQVEVKFSLKLDRIKLEINKCSGNNDFDLSCNPS